ncbi:unnamed protein product, partial [Staurois parvus]
RTPKGIRNWKNFLRKERPSSVLVERIVQFQPGKGKESKGAFVYSPRTGTFCFTLPLWPVQRFKNRFFFWGVLLNLKEYVRQHAGGAEEAMFQERADWQKGEGVEAPH